MNVKEIIERYFSSSHDKETSDIFAEWISEDTYSEEKDQALLDQWNSDCYVSKSAVEDSYEAVMARINARTGVVRRRNRSRIWFGVASAMIAASVAVAVVFPMFNSPTEVLVETAPSAMTECYADNGEKQVITLPDSTVVILNSGSLLIYPKEFTGPERRVYLTGEAIFDVTSDEAKPFLVSTQDMNVRVHGTYFNVSSYMDSEYSETSLKEGSVSVLGKSGLEYLLTPGQSLRYDRTSSKYTVSQSYVDEVFSWKEGSLCFRSESIHSIIKTIGRYYGIRVYLTTGKYDNEKVTAKFIHGETIEEMLSALCLVVPGMTYQIENSTVYVK